MKKETDLLIGYLNGIDMMVSYFPRHENKIHRLFPNDYSLYDIELEYSMKLATATYLALSILVQALLLFLSLGGVSIGFGEWWMLPSLLILSGTVLILLGFKFIPLVFDWWFSK